MKSSHRAKDKGWVFQAKRNSARNSTRNSTHGFRDLWPLFLLALAIFLLIFGRIQPHWAERARTNISDWLSPAYSLLAQPLESVNNGIDFVQGWYGLANENIALRREVEQLRSAAQALPFYQNQNAELLNLLSYQPKNTKRIMTAQIIGTGGDWLNSILIDQGAEHGVKQGMVAVDGQAMIGRVVEVGRVNARIMLLSDANSRIPALILGNKTSPNSQAQGTQLDDDMRLRFILAGSQRGEDQERLARPMFVAPNVDLSSLNLETGMQVVTSGDGDLLPAGLYIGRLVRLKNEGGLATLQDNQTQNNQTMQSLEEQGWRIILASNPQTLSYVRLLDY